MQGPDDIEAHREAVLRQWADNYRHSWIGMHARRHQTAPAPEPPPRGGHTELALVRLTHEDTRIRRGGGLPAVWSAYS